ncbi:glycosyltransferase family 4 protein [Celeribacter litoreus]|uniref:glycosyltransferase family 4 protein n=1 Tax=Celeribacter litoreus TaxID=2876714 RepID=UPI001CC984BB|nr:glycosyltransferase family 4 protein [Celeribacter litoreus]MCA0042071.1 glycosyltransferase family 4 protein [Celeribacter litoreus]
MFEAQKPHRLLLLGGAGEASGVPRHIVDLCGALKDDVLITVLSDRNRGGYDAIDAMGIERREIEGLSTSYHIGRCTKVVSALHTEIKAGGYDLVWAHARMPVLLLRLMGPWLPASMRRTITFHGLPFSTGHPRAHRMGSLLLERALARIGTVDAVFLSRAQRDHYISRVGTTSNIRPHVLGNSSFIGAPGISPRPKGEIRLIMTARHSYQKNLPAAARLFAHLPHEFRLDIYGHGTQDDDLRAAFRRELSETAFQRVRFLGQTSDVRAALETADGYLLTSRYEGLPIGAIEAMEAGLPCALPAIESTRDLCRHNPYSAALPLQSPKPAADRIVAMMQRFKADELTARHEIRAAWRHHYAPEQWRTDARALFGRLIDAPPSQQSLFMHKASATEAHPI